MFYKRNLLLILSLIIITFNSFPQQKSNLKNEAISLKQSGRFGEAIELLNRYISANPQDAEGYNLRGICYEQRGNFELAVYDYRTAKKISPTDKEISINLERAIKNWYTLLYNRIEGYKREIAINSGIASNYLEVGKSYKNLGEWNEAEVWYDLYLQKEEASADEIIRYSEILAKNNHIAKGEPILKNYTIKYPDDHRIWSRYGYFTLWLGKNKIAIDAFSRALELRPFFKEALDGLDLAKGKGYIYTINDTSSKFNYGLSTGAGGYIIDNYYKRLKSNPDYDEIRFNLIEELIKVNRYEEAYLQLKFLSAKYIDDTRFKELWDEVSRKRAEYYYTRIDELMNRYLSNPNDEKLVLELANYYSYLNHFSKAIEICNDYLSRNNSSKIKFTLAKFYLWSGNLCKARELIEELYYNANNDKDVNLFLAQVYFWMNIEPDKSLELFNEVLKVEPENQDAMIGSINLYIAKNDFTEAKLLNQKLASYKIEIAKELENKIQLAEYNFSKQKAFEILERARNYAYFNNCYDAEYHYREYLKINNDPDVQIELANVYQCIGDYNSAINIYTNVLENNSKTEWEKNKAKLFLWSGDSLNALREFKNLSSKYSNDLEIKLYLGDAYLKTGNLKTAKEIYLGLLKLSPDSYLIKNRLSWIDGDYGSFGSSFASFFQISPYASFFSDNLDFKYFTQGISLTTGLSSNIAVGVNFNHGNLESEIDKQNFGQVRGLASIRFSDIVSMNTTVGQTFFRNEKNKLNAELSLTANEIQKYSIGLNYNYSDAAFILYSPFLVKERLNANYFSVFGKYFIKNSLILNAKFGYLDISDGNNGNQLSVRIGKNFEEDLTVGYEYYFYSMSKLTILYWSPDNFESHSLFADWNAIYEYPVKISLGGKFGLIPQNSFIVTEGYFDIQYSFEKNLSLSTRFFTGSSYRDDASYRSLSFQLALYWNL